MVKPPRARVLCVDDEPDIVEGLALNLRRVYDVEVATSGEEGLKILGRDPSIVVVVSDMRMPEMDGAEFLARVRRSTPDVVRLLLTGHADIDAAVAVVNEGGIFRFLTKPCPPPTLLGAIADAVDQHRLVTAERELLEKTLHGSIKALTDVLALISPVSFGRATRIKQLVTELADKLALRDRWQVEVAAMLSQLGAITLSEETAEKAYYNRPLSTAEQRQIERLPALTEELLGNIPRLEGVRDILTTCARSHRRVYQPPDDARQWLVARSAQILKAAMDFDALETGGKDSEELALLVMRGREGQYDPEVLQALSEIRGEGARVVIKALSVFDLRAGMIVAEDIKQPNGVLLVGRGDEITERLIERVQNFPPALMPRGLWRVVIPPRLAEDEPA